MSNIMNATDLLALQNSLNTLNLELQSLRDQVNLQQNEIEDSEEARLNFWLLIAATNILFMQAGFALLEVGTVQAKNAKSILFKNIVDCCTGIIIWWLFGYGLSQGGFNDSDRANFGNLRSNEAIYFFHSFTYSTTCATIISGGVAERISFAAYMGIAGIMVGFFYPLLAYWCWADSGFLYELGYTDFAGSGAIHALGGIATLVSAWQLGPRIGRFNYDEEHGQVEVHDFKGHSPVLSALGTFILLFGWFSFNASSTLGADINHFQLSARAVVNTMLAASAASLTGIVWRQKQTGVHDLEAVNNTLLCGAVSITGCCAYVDFWVSPIVGALSTVAYYFASNLSLSFRVDDPLDAFAVHGGGGIWGVIATGLFTNPVFLDEGRPGGLLFGCGGKLMAAQIVGLLVMVAWGAFAFGLVVFGLNRIPGFQLRADKDAELLGLDFAYHDGFAYPDFNKQNILTFNEMRAAEKRVEARNKGRKKDVRKVADFTQAAIRKRKGKKKHAGSSSWSQSNSSTNSKSSRERDTATLSIPSHSSSRPTFSYSNPRSLNNGDDGAESKENQLRFPTSHQEQDRRLSVFNEGIPSGNTPPLSPNEKAQLLNRLATGGSTDSRSDLAAGASSLNMRDSSSEAFFPNSSSTKGNLSPIVPKKDASLTHGSTAVV